jgi:LPXTG-motif cell wall-anchored protein
MKALRIVAALAVMAVIALVLCKHVTLAQPPSRSAAVSVEQSGAPATGINNPAQPAAQSSAQTGSPPETGNAQSGALPETGSALPLISVIGFGVLVGGIASALKTRSSR